MAYYEEVSKEWPLIHYVLSDSLYRAFYANELKRMLQGPLSASAYQTKVGSYVDLVEPYADSPNFSENVRSLREFMSSRVSMLLALL